MLIFARSSRNRRSRSARKGHKQGAMGATLQFYWRLFERESDTPDSHDTSLGSGIALSFCEGKDQPTAQQALLTRRQFVELLKDHREARPILNAEGQENKPDGPGFSPAIFFSAHRTAANAEVVSWFIVDIDGGPALEDLGGAWRDYDWIAYSSF